MTLRQVNNFKYLAFFKHLNLTKVLHRSIESILLSIYTSLQPNYGNTMLPLSGIFQTEKVGSYYLSAYLCEHFRAGVDRFWRKIAQQFVTFTSE